MSCSLCDETSSRPLVIVIHASVGSGHRSAAQAVAQAFEDACGVHPLLPADTEVAVLDVLDYGYIRFDGDKTVGATVSFNKLYDFTWHRTFTGRLLWGGGSIWSWAMFSRFTKLVEARRPLAIVATHIVGANVAVAARMVTGQTFPVVCVPTDYGAEGLWPHLGTDLFCAADEIMVKELLPRKVPRENIVVTGIPVRKGFTQSYDRTQVLQRFGLPHDKLVVMVMAGARVSQPYLPFRAIFDQVVPLLSDFPRMHFALLAGSDEEYAATIRATIVDRAIDNVTVFDYVDDVPALMNASDLIVAKSGGLATTECLCARLPLILVGHPYGQEYANTVTVTKAGAAVCAETSAELVDELEHIHSDPHRLQTMVVGGEALRRPHAANDIVEATMEVSKRTKSPRKHFFHVYWGHKPYRVR